MATWHPHAGSGWTFGIFKGQRNAMNYGQTLQLLLLDGTKSPDENIMKFKAIDVLEEQLQANANLNAHKNRSVNALYC
jgi:hypothetical protein